MDEIKEILTYLGFNPKYISNLFVGIGLVYLTLACRKWYTKKIGKIDRLAKDVITVKADSNKLSNLVTSVQGTLAEVGKTLAVHTGILDVIKLMVLGKKLVIDPGSPLRLTTAGDLASKSVKGRDMIGRYLSDFREKTKLDKATPYEIQEECFRFSRHILPGIIFEPDKKSLSSEAFSRGWDIALMYEILGIEIRNFIFAEREISLKDIDEGNSGDGE